MKREASARTDSSPAPAGYPELRRFEHGPFRFSEPDLYDRHLMFDNGVDAAHAGLREKFDALARSLRDVLTQRWVLSRRTHESANPKQVYYLSMEFLIGRSLTNNILNMGVERFVREDLQSDQQDWRALAEQEPEAGLGNGGLGRLAACFIDSLATLEIPAVGYGLRYDYGMFRQTLENGEQCERPDNWLRRPDPWEVARPDRCQSVEFATGWEQHGGEFVLTPGQHMTLVGAPFDRPVVGLGGKTINTLRLWGASTHDSFNLGEFNSGDYFGAVSERVRAESLTRVLYPDDSRAQGRSLRFMQEAFLVCCSLGDIVQRFLRRGNAWDTLSSKVAIQLNDTHPAIAVAELMRILLDRARLPWDQAWQLTVDTLAYTNHTLLPEALEKWPVELFEALLPRHLEIIYEINARLLADARTRLGSDDARIAAISLIEEQPLRSVRMANLAIVGSHSTNGVSQLHSELVRSSLVPHLHALFPQRFNNKTNGVSPRRWLAYANPPLRELISEAIGDDWVRDLSRLSALRPLATDAAFGAAFLRAKRVAKQSCLVWLEQRFGVTVDPDSIFDCHIKRIHEYKRQLLNLLHIALLYRRLRSGSAPDGPARTFLFAGKAAPAYHIAKLVIRLINTLAARIDADPAAKGHLQLLFLPDYSVSMAERVIAASDVSEQISTAGFEASGTSNMKFMLNGALTVGTRDGATVEIAAAAGEENAFLFGLSAAEVAASRSWYDPSWHIAHQDEVRDAVEFLFSREALGDPAVFEPIRQRLVHGDYYMHLADLRSYVGAQARVAATYREPATWARKAVLNVAASGRFSSDRSIAEYAREIWDAAPCPIPE